MISAMRTLALDFLWQEESKGSDVDSQEEWYQALCRQEPQRLFPYLVEDSGKIELVFVLEKISEEMVSLTVQEIATNSGGCTKEKIPFMRPTGSQSSQVGPVIKRTYDKNNGGGPSAKILGTTMKYFEEITQSNRPWASYFQDIVKILESRKVQLPDNTTIDWKKEGYTNLLSCAVDKIGPQKTTVFLTVKDSNGLFPGENNDYIEYLLKDKLAGERYQTKNSPAQEMGSCNLCDAKDVTVYPNGLKGAGLNFINVDRVGIFPGIKAENAWRGFGICSPCADLLYIYKNHVLKKGGKDKKQLPFGTRIAGEQALVIPKFLPGLPVQERLMVLNDVNKYINDFTTDVETTEDNLLEILKDEKSILNLDLLWSDIGQNIENVSGIITSLLPSRLREISEINIQGEDWRHPIFPEVEVYNEPSSFKPDLGLNGLKPFFYRPGGEKAKGANASRQLFELKKNIAACVYHQRLIPLGRFEEELITTARWYWLEAIKKKDGHWGLLQEGFGKKGNYLTAAGWIRHVNWWLYYFKEVGVLEREQSFFEPQMEELKPYFGPESNINQPEKAFAFLLGVLYGRLLEIQGARGVNVSANALTWLKRLTLKGADLPELYNKVRAKLLSYEGEKSEKVRNLIHELSVLGIRLGENIKFSETQTNYYLLLGQAMSRTILKSDKGADKE